MKSKRGTETPRWRFLITLYCTVLVSGLLYTATTLAQITPKDPPSLSDCIETAADSDLNCTANDVTLGLLIVADPNAQCTETSPGSGVFTADVQFQADLVAGANERWDIGMWIDLEGGDARTGSQCARNYLPAYPDPLADPGDPGSPGLGNGVGPHYDGEENEDPNDMCGDLPQGINWYYDLLPLSVATGTPTSTTPETYTIRCEDNDDDGFVDVGTCTSWDNNRNTQCTSVYDTVPNTKAKCNCEPS